MRPTETSPRTLRPNLVMILGASHSGTTMLDLMLGNHRETFSTGEAWAFFRPWRKHHFHPVCGCGQEPCEIWQHLLEVPENRFHITAANLPGISNVVDSSKDLSWAIDAVGWSRDARINIHNIVIWKEPIELAFSHWKRGKSVSSFRQAFLTYYERFLNSQLPFTSVRYSTVVANPSNTVKQLCEISGLPWKPGQEKFWQKKHHQLFGASATRKQARSGNSTINAATTYPNEFLDEFAGYSRAMANDQRLMRVIGALDSMGVEKSYVPKFSALAAPASAMRPLWYYRHAIKRVVYRHFPREFESTLSTDVV